MTVAARVLRVGNLMTIDPVLIDADAMASEAERLLKTHRVSGPPVVSAGVTAGVISQTDLVVARSSGMISGNQRVVTATPAPPSRAPRSTHKLSCSSTSLV